MENYEQVKHKAYYVPVDELELLENNPRTISKEQFDKLKKSVSERRAYFEGRPCLVNHKDGKMTVFAGNQRLRAARDLKMDKVPCVVYENLSKKEEKELTVLDNGEFGRWDMEILANEFSDLPLEELMGEEFDKVATELTPEQEVEEDEPPEVDESEPAKSKPGEVYLLGNHRLMCGDSTDEAQVARLMDGNKADMVFTDPPYNVAIGDRNKVLNALAAGERIERNLEGDVFKSDEEAGEKLWLPAFGNMLKSANDVCAIYVTMPQGGTHMMMMMMMMMAEAGWQVKHELIWVKNSPTFSMGRLDYDYQHEPICFGWKKGHKKIGKGKFTKSIWTIDKPKKDGDHPTMKPVELVANAIMNSSEDEDRVLDLFGGSGSTLIACEQTNRQCFMMELAPHYCDVIRKRFVKFTTGVEDNWEELTPREEK